MTWELKTFEQLTNLELYAILQERTAVFVVEQHCPYQEVDGKDPASYHLLYREEGRILAYARLLPPGVSYPEASIGRVIVKQSARGRGLAKELLRRSIAFIQQELGEKAIKIQAQEYLKDFYGSFGFAPVSGVYLEDDIPHVDMVLYQE
ncbi:GNAT family N-acetyltransferase [Paenibacillus sp. JX-17]|uniref:GNAT family N-acetyltransferase n=1 Tax=Paenibacillus lacisoli TaxID=3064525 RepID=A0ABT9C7W8_9BACL|nr:GNAT family N-acetyltransferase [Paenibacillus sp. JX-17]MDO7905357.1 GNAT family N-acetyltransferase [Paenibacillus sp. JX-17]